MIDKKRDKKFRKAMEGIYESIRGVSKPDIICMLEQVKLDILINGKMVILDNKIQVKKKI